MSTMFLRWSLSERNSDSEDKADSEDNDDIADSDEIVDRTYNEEVLEEWEKREAIYPSRNEIRMYPSVLKYILGRKEKKPCVKVFFKERDIKAEAFFKKEGSYLSKETTCEFVNLEEEKKNTWKKQKAIEIRERKAQAVSPSTKTRTDEIVRREGEKICAKHSSVVGIDVSNVLAYFQGVIQTPCIVLYCLDESLVPLGENLLPRNIDGFPCDIRVDLVMFGSCRSENCATVNPGCDIGSLHFAGSAGFLVNTPYEGFLTAAHVAVENAHVIYKDQSNSFDNTQGSDEEIMHPSDSVYRVGTVENLIFGNYCSYGADVAIVRKRTASASESFDAHQETLEIAEPDPLPSEELQVVKKGKTTNVTHGVYGGILLLARLRFGIASTGRYYLFKKCYRINDETENNQFFDEGNSGSGVFLIERQDSRVKPLGIAFGRFNCCHFTLVCKIKHIAEQLTLLILSDAFSIRVLQTFTFSNV